MTVAVKVSPQFQISVPIIVAKQLHLKPGMRLSFSPDPNNPQAFIVQNLDNQIESLAGMVNGEIKKQAPEMIGINDEQLDQEIEKSKYDGR
jgi:bifunctional DNA-binding transcriptional regulator/antitoxin component of YhaV-PrlF toxin-antitoxin module